jgi:hypothetical protein
LFDGKHTLQEELESSLSAVEAAALGGSSGGEAAMPGVFGPKPAEGFDSDGQRKWTNEHGDFHRLDGPAFEDEDGHKSWWVDGKRHRLDGPAIEGVDGEKQWWVDGDRHRVGGPAVVRADGIPIRNEFAVF